MDYTFSIHKSCGTMIGAAIGDAIGAPVEGLKPGHIKTLFKTLNTYIDSFKYKKKGIKHFCLKGLYTDDTQQILAVCDTVLSHQTITTDLLSDTFISMCKENIPGGFGIMRGTGYFFRRTMNDYLKGASWDQVDGSSAGCMGAVRIAPLSVYYADDPIQLKVRIIEAVLVTHKDPIAISAALFHGYIIAHLLKLTPGTQLDIPQLMNGCAQFCKEGEQLLASQYSNILYASHPEGIYSVSAMIDNLSPLLQAEDKDQIDAYILNYAQQYASRPVHKLTVPFALTLVPLALRIFLSNRHSFQDSIIEAVNMGGDTDTLACLVGSLSGAYHGLNALPSRWVADLVNMNQLKLRAEALVKGKKGISLQDLVTMEKKLTQREYELVQKCESSVSAPKKSAKKQASSASSVDPKEAVYLSARESEVNRRQYEREKSMEKRKRRQNKII